MNTIIYRTPWADDFPNVIVHGDLTERNKHADFAAAKVGDAEAARRLVLDLVSDAGMAQLETLLAGRRPLVVPVAAIEVGGFNAIPDAMAQELATRLGLQLEPYELRQSNTVAHTRADGWHRLVTPATFTGAVATGLEYLLIDDHVGFGGTLANLRGYIEVNGGRVIGMTTLTETRGGHQIAIRPETLNMLHSKHGEELEQFWQAIFGHGTDCLTDIEAGYLSRVESVAAIQARMAQAATAARRLGLPAVSFKPAP